MKRLIYISILVLVVILAASCNYNGKATIKVRNVGELTVTVRMQTAISYISPGGEDIFELEWPGHADQTINFVAYPQNQPEKAEYKVITVKDGDYLEFEVAFYPE